MIEIANTLTFKPLRDLVWLIGSTPLHTPSDIPSTSDAWCQSMLLKHMPWLHDLQKNSTQLQTHIQHFQSHKLGHYFEHLFKFWMANSPYFGLIADHVQVNDTNGRSLTEIDFIVKDLEGQFWHFETAIKFYLETDSGNFVGPNAKDTLSRKLDTVRRKQISVFETPEGTDILRRYGIDSITSELFLKGYLIPHANKPGDFPFVWIHAKEVNFVQYRQDCWCILPKAYWLCPTPLAEGELFVLSAAEIQKEITKKFRSDENSHLVVCQMSKAHGLYYMKKCWMLVQNDWPH